jgi:hypothetical protein
MAFIGTLEIWTAFLTRQLPPQVMKRLLNVQLTWAVGLQDKELE